MLLPELCPSLARRLAGLLSPLLRVPAGPSSPLLRVPPGPFVSLRLSSAPLSLTSDDADEPRDPSERGRRPGDAYVEPSHTRRAYLERFLRRELGLSWAGAQREAARCRHLATAGLPLMTENLAFLTDCGVSRQHVQEDVDVLGVAHSNLLRVHNLISTLPEADYRHYYPLSRARPDTVSGLFRRLLTRRSNLVRELADILRLPELTVSRAVSRMATQITKTSNGKMLNNARLLIELGVPAEELSHSLYLLRLSGPRLRHRQQQCAAHGLPLLARYLAMSDHHFQRRLTRGGRLSEATPDVESLVASRLGVSRERVVEHTRHSDVLQTLTAARLEAVTELLERAGYGAMERLSALLTVYRTRPERLQRRLEVCRRLGRGRPSLALLAIDERRFQRRVARWRREKGGEGVGGEMGGEGRGGGETGSGSETRDGEESDPGKGEGETGSGLGGGEGQTGSEQSWTDEGRCGVTQ